MAPKPAAPRDPVTPKQSTPPLRGDKPVSGSPDTTGRRSRRAARASAASGTTAPARPARRTFSTLTVTASAHAHKLRQKIWLSVLAGVGTLALLAICGFGGYLMVQEERDGPLRMKNAGPSAQARDISKRLNDPAALTDVELFPGPQLKLKDVDQPYAVLNKQASNDCKVAATDELGNTFTSLGCNQVVRGTLKSPDGQYLITAGIFNFPDLNSASQADQGIKPILDAGKGRLIGLAAGPGAEPIMRAPSKVSKFVRGHYLVYSIVVRADASPIPADDIGAQQVEFDLTKTHLRDTVIAAREAPIGAAPAGAPSGAPSAKT